jgi:PST family polysaccharide transporter
MKNATALLRASFYFMGSELTHIAQHHLDRLLIGSFLGAVSLGAYTIAAKVNRIAISILQESLLSVGLPTFSRLRSDPERLRTAFYQSQRLGTALTLPAFVLLILTAEPLVQLVLGAQWLASVPLLQALCLASCAMCIGLFNTPLLQAVGRSDIALRLSILSVVTAVAAFFLARQWGVLAVSLAFAVRTWLLLPLELHLVQRFAAVPSRPVWVGVLRQLFTLLPLVAAVYGFQALTTGWPAWPQLLCTLALGASVYLITLALVDRKVLRQLAGIPQLLLAREK